MTRRRLIDAQTAQSRASAEGLVSGSAPPRIRRAAKGRKATKANRSGTVHAPYLRGDGVETAKFQASLNVEVLAALDRYMLIVKPRGFSRGEWVEAAIDHCVATNFMPPPKLQIAEVRSNGGAELRLSTSAEQQEEETDDAP